MISPVGRPNDIVCAARTTSTSNSRGSAVGIPFLRRSAHSWAASRIAAVVRGKYLSSLAEINASNLASDAVFPARINSRRNSKSTISGTKMVAPPDNCFSAHARHSSAGFTPLRWVSRLSGPESRKIARITEIFSWRWGLRIRDDYDSAIPSIPRIHDFDVQFPQDHLSGLPDPIAPINQGWLDLVCQRRPANCARQHVWRTRPRRFPGALPPP